jgi:hypothetical protein
LSVAPTTELIIDLVMHVKHAISYSELIVGFIGDLDKKPLVTKYCNRYVSVGRGKEVNPAEEREDDYIDKHLYYHRRVSRTVSRGTVLSSAFTIQTRSEGLYPFHVLFVSEEPIGEEWFLFITVERTETIRMQCLELKHKLRDCWQKGLARPP